MSNTPHSGSDAQYLTVSVAGQTLGIPVLLVDDVLGPQRITRVPLAPPAVLGSLNMRGHIVTAIDVRRTLGFAAAESAARMCVVVEHKGELYSLTVDGVGEVVSLSAAELVSTPITVAAVWREVSKGIYRTPEQLLIILDVDRLLAGLAQQDKTAGAATPTALAA
jgi:purine-binding chemotaxis protein CheW